MLAKYYIIIYRYIYIYIYIYIIYIYIYIFIINDMFHEVRYWNRLFYLFSYNKFADDTFIVFQPYSYIDISQLSISNCINELISSSPVTIFL